MASPIYPNLMYASPYFPFTFPTAPTMPYYYPPMTMNVGQPMPPAQPPTRSAMPQEPQKESQSPDYQRLFGHGKPDPLGGKPGDLYVDLDSPDCSLYVRYMDGWRAIDPRLMGRLMAAFHPIQEGLALFLDGEHGPMWVSQDNLPSGLDGYSTTKSTSELLRSYVESTMPPSPSQKRRAEQADVPANTRPPKVPRVDSDAHPPSPRTVVQDAPVPVSTAQIVTPTVMALQSIISGQNKVIHRVHHYADGPYAFPIAGAGGDKRVHYYWDSAVIPSEEKGIPGDIFFLLRPGEAPHAFYKTSNEWLELPYSLADTLKNKIHHPTSPSHILIVRDNTSIDEIWGPEGENISQTGCVPTVSAWVEHILATSRSPFRLISSPPSTIEHQTTSRVLASGDPASKSLSANEPSPVQSDVHSQGDQTFTTTIEPDASPAPDITSVEDEEPVLIEPEASLGLETGELNGPTSPGWTSDESAPDLTELYEDMVDELSSDTENDRYQVQTSNIAPGDQASAGLTLNSAIDVTSIGDEQIQRLDNPSENQWPNLGYWAGNEQTVGTLGGEGALDELVLSATSTTSTNNTNTSVNHQESANDQIHRLSQHLPQVLQHIPLLHSSPPSRMGVIREHMKDTVARIFFVTGERGDHVVCRRCLRFKCPNETPTEVLLGHGQSDHGDFWEALWLMSDRQIELIYQGYQSSTFSEVGN